MSDDITLVERIKTLIVQNGPISVAEYMTLCLLDPVQGYYPTRDPLGADGDFITAPEISQMFGEVIGLWVIQAFKDLSKFNSPPETFHLIELGPGRGIMMSDILRSLKLAKDARAAVQVHLIEASAALEAQQAKTLSECGVPVFWHTDLSSVPAGPSVIIGNEFVDCLPIRQLIQRDPFAKADGWRERLVGYDADARRFRYVESTTPLSPTLKTALPSGHVNAKTDDILEINPSANLLLDAIGTRFKDHPGRALFIDYGPETTEFGDTFQALKRHEKVGVFSDPGHTDLTARVDFEALQNAARTTGLESTASIPQSMLLSRLGIEMRAVALARSSPKSRETIARQLTRLMDSDEMGTLFRAICFQTPGLDTPLGFDAK